MGSSNITACSSISQSSAGSGSGAGVAAGGAIAGVVVLAIVVVAIIILRRRQSTAGIPISQLNIKGVIGQLYFGRAFQGELKVQTV